MEGPARDLVGYGRDAPKVRWPEDVLVAINLVVVYEEGAERRAVAGDAVNDGWGEYAPAAVEAPARDLGTETHYEYGSRAGIWRLARIADGLGVPVTLSAAAVALELNPEVAAWVSDTGHDLLGHGWRWLPPWELDRAEEAEQLDRAIASYERLLGLRPDAYGWNSRSLPSVHTRELLAERGFLYDSDPCNDDLPYWTRAGGKPLLVVPYTKTLNDARYLVSPGFSSPRDFVDTCRAALDELLREAPEVGGRMMTVAVHARWSGQPARAAAVRELVEHALSRDGVRFMRRLDIARFWIETHPPS
jgi:peptidoglycan/xylan/chitin deacetylase (PgdA/CDA1 family)